MPWPCAWCGQFNTGFSPNRDPAAASATELAAEVARHGLPHRMAGVGDRGSTVLVPGSSPDPADRDAGNRDLTSAAGIARPDAALPLPGQAEAPRRSGRRPLRHVALLIAVAGACIAAAFVALASGSPRAAGVALRQGGGGQDGVMRVVQVTADRVGGIDFQGVAGQLTIVSTGSSRVVLTGQLHGVGSAPVVETRLDRAGDVLVVSVRCAPGNPCTENLRLAVPAGTRAAVRQPSGRILVSGLPGPLSITR